MGNKELTTKLHFENAIYAREKKNGVIEMTERQRQ